MVVSAINVVWNIFIFVHIFFMTFCFIFFVFFLLTVRSQVAVWPVLHVVWMNVNECCVSHVKRYPFRRPIRRSEGLLSLWDAEGHFIGYREECNDQLMVQDRVLILSITSRNDSDYWWKQNISLLLFLKICGISKFWTVLGYQMYLKNVNLDTYYANAESHRKVIIMPVLPHRYFTWTRVCRAYTYFICEETHDMIEKIV